MNYSVKVRRVIENGKPLKATCSVTMDDQFTVHGVKVIQNEKGRFIAMPSEAYKDNDGNERFRDVCHKKHRHHCPGINKQPTKPNSSQES